MFLHLFTNKKNQIIIYNVSVQKWLCLFNINILEFPTIVVFIVWFSYWSEEYSNYQLMEYPRLLYNNIKLIWILYYSSWMFFCFVTKRINRLYWNNYWFFCFFFFPNWKELKTLFCWLTDCIFYVVLPID